MTQNGPQIRFEDLRSVEQFAATTVTKLGDIRGDIDILFKQHKDLAKQIGDVSKAQSDLRIMLAWAVFIGTGVGTIVGMFIGVILPKLIG